MDLYLRKGFERWMTLKKITFRISFLTQSPTDQKFLQTFLVVTHAKKAFSKNGSLNATSATPIKRRRGSKSEQKKIKPMFVASVR
jgi:hypothetical protein